MYNTFIRRRRGRLSRSDVDPAAPLDEARGGGRCGCVSVLRLRALVCSRSLFVSSAINVLYRGGRPCRRPRPATHSKNKVARKKKKFAHDVKKMSISARRCRENLNNDRLQKIMGNTFGVILYGILCFGPSESHLGSSRWLEDGS